MRKYFDLKHCSALLAVRMRGYEAECEGRQWRIFKWNPVAGEIRPGLIHLLLTEHNGQTGRRAGTHYHHWAPIGRAGLSWPGSVQGGLGELLLQNCNQRQSNRTLRPPQSPLSTVQLREQINSHTLKTSPPVNNFQGRQKPSQGLSRFCASTSIIMYKYSSSSLAGFLSILVRSGIESLCLWIEKNVAELPASLRSPIIMYCLDWFVFSLSQPTLS